MNRRSNFQNISWLYDQFIRKNINLDPPYQRRSVWPESYRSYLIETILLSYPMPAIFLFEEISPSGRTMYNVVDGKQRLLTIFSFIKEEFSLSDKISIENKRGLYFSDFADEDKSEFWGYPILIEYLPSYQESILDNIFDRINRNVVKLTPQELRHAKLDGLFIAETEDVGLWFLEELPKDFPHFSTQQLRQMKEVEFIATLLMFQDVGAESFSQIGLDQYFIDHDENWKNKHKYIDEFKYLIKVIKEVVNESEKGIKIRNSRLKNIADFYSMYACLCELSRENLMPDINVLRKNILVFIQGVESENDRNNNTELQEYYDAARSASNDKKQRLIRIKKIKSAILK